MLHHKNAILIAPNFATHCGVLLYHLWKQVKIIGDML